MSKKVAGSFKLPSQPAPKPPRSVEEIQKDVNEALFAIGNAEYKIHVFKKYADSAKEALITLNQEGEARQKLDAEKAKADEQTETKQEETK